MKRSKTSIIYYGFLAVLYLLLELILPANKIVLHEYRLNTLQYHILLFLVAIPVIALWFMAFYGYSRLDHYAKSIASTPEGPAFEGLAKGLLWLAWGIPIPSIVSLILNSIANSYSGFHSTAIVVANYLTLLVPLTAFSILAIGTRQLRGNITFKESILYARPVLLVFIVFAIFYCYLVLKHLLSHGLGSANNPYYLPVWILSITVTIPYLYAWFIGLLAAYDIAAFGRLAPGLLYRQPLQTLAIGLVAVIASLIVLQYINSVVPRTGHLSLDYALASSYLVRIIAALGYVLIALGAERLIKIEEV